jgi:hypothetical protein
MSDGTDAARWDPISVSNAQLSCCFLKDTQLTLKHCPSCGSELEAAPSNNEPFTLNGYTFSMKKWRCRNDKCAVQSITL